MHEGLWTATFRASTGGHGTGVAVLRGGTVQGGDAQYFYVGTYRVSPGPNVGADLEAELTITRYNQASGTTSVFGPLQQFVLQLKGKTAPASMSLTGSIQGQTGMTISMELQKRAD